MHSCHGHAAITPTDPRFESDDFTRAALAERRARAAHAHFGAFVLAVLGGLVFAHACKALRRAVR